MKSRSKIQLRPYQLECIGKIPEKGSYLIQMATGLGKTVTFSQIPRRGRMLILSHRQELVDQPVKYFDVPVGIEQGDRTSHGEEVISASVQSLKNRLKKFNKDYFDIIITDEAHHAAAKTYQDIYKHFNPRLHLGFTATPNRHDKIGLFPTFKKVIFEYPLRKGVLDGYLSDIECIRAKVAVDFTQIRSRAGEFVQEDLEKVMLRENNVKAIAQAYEQYSKGPTLIFACSAGHAKEISKKIKDSKIVLGETPKEERKQIIEDFKNGKFKCLVNCMVLTEGADIPNIETIIMAKPTQSETLYCLDSETEILTKSGWKKNIEIGELVATFNKDNNAIEFKPCLSTINRDLEPDEFFCSITGPQEDIRVTNKHRMLYDNKRKKGWKFKTAEEIANLKDGCYIPASGHGKFKGVPLTDDELRFIGWFMTDGCLNKANNTIRISQSIGQPWFKEIEKCLKGCGFKYGKVKNNSPTQFKSNSQRYVFTISKGKPRGRDNDKRGWGDLEPYISKDIPETLFDMTEEQFDVMLEAIHLGDGSKQFNQSWTRRSYHIATGNLKFAENLQIMALQRGYKANLAKRTNNNGNPIYTIHLKKKVFNHLGSTYDSRPKWIKEDHTNEKCWCVETEAGTLVTRRNGKVAIVGNCQMVGRGTRKYPGKEKLRLVDVVGVTACNKLCTFPNLLGIDTSLIPFPLQDELVGDLLDIEKKAEQKADVFDNWIRSAELVDIWAQEEDIDTHNINFIRMPDGSLKVQLTQTDIVIPPPDALGKVYNAPLQHVIDRLFYHLMNFHSEDDSLWDLGKIEFWKNEPITQKQINRIYRLNKNLEGKVEDLNRFEAHQLINRLSW